MKKDLCKADYGNWVLFYEVSDSVYYSRPVNGVRYTSLHAANTLVC